MSINWKKTGILTVDILLGVYLVLAITAFNRPDDQDAVCREVKINITDDAGNGFLNVNEVKMQLQHAKIYPLGDCMSDVCTRKIEETLLKSPLVDHVECYKTQSGQVFINLSQRIAVMRIMANNGESYYIDNLGSIIPSKNNSTDLVVATGDIKRKYAQTALKQFGLLLLDEVILTEIYPARELPIEGVTSQLIFDRLRPGIEKQMIQKDDVLQLVKSRSFDVLIVLGAGDLDNMVPQMAQILKEKM